MRNKYRVLSFIVTLLFIIGWTWLVSLLGASGIISYVGANNIFIIAFITAAVGGASIFTSVSYYTFIATLTHSDINIFLLSIVMGTGMMVGDSLFFFLGKETRVLLPQRVRKHVDGIVDWTARQHDVLIFFVALLWAGIVPVPNDILTVGGGIASIKWYILLPGLWIGNILFIYLFATVAVPLVV